MRDLNKEYRDMVLEETPDIWSKIEAGLDERQQPVKKKKVLRFNRTMGYMTAAAAAIVCICIAIPVIRGSMSADMAAETAAPTANHVRDNAGKVAAVAEAFDKAAGATAEADTSSYAYSRDADSKDKKLNVNGDMNYLTVPSSEAMGDEAACEAEESSLDAAKAETAEAEAAYTLLMVSYAPGADIDSLKDIIEEYGLGIYEKNDEAVVLTVPAGIDMDELLKNLADNKNVAYSEVL